MACWCGNQKLIRWCDAYQLCEACQTLCAHISESHADPRVKDDFADLYGRDYWFKHQTDELNCADIITRSRTDLAERGIHWLRSLLQFKLPPANVLEIGCAHGGFVAMMNQAGFQASGLELSPSIVELARDIFSVEVLTGPIEDQKIEIGSLDAIVMMDVMEHLPNPLQTLGRCMDLLKPDGILLVQTPAYPEHTSLSDLKTSSHKFPMMLDANEHLFLFSRQAASELFQRLHVPHIRFIPAIFGFYDMSFVVSRELIADVSKAERDQALSASVPARMMRALLDLDDRRLELLEKYRKLKKPTVPAA